MVERDGMTGEEGTERTNGRKEKVWKQTEEGEVRERKKG